VNLRDLVFRLRGWTPVPFLLAALIWADYALVRIIAGLAIALPGELLRIWAIRHAGGATRTRNVGAPFLARTGPYSRLRNPLYLANLLLYTGFTIGSGAFFPHLAIGVALFFTLQYALIISLEESILRRIFGAEYDSYCREVPRFLPRLKAESNAQARFSLWDALIEERSTLLGLGLSWLLLAVRMNYLPSP